MDFISNQDMIDVIIKITIRKSEDNQSVFSVALASIYGRTNFIRVNKRILIIHPTI